MPSAFSMCTSAELCVNSPTATLAAAAPVLVESFEPIISTPQDDSGDRLYARRDANRHGLQSMSRVPDRSRRTARQGHRRKLRQGLTLNRRRNHNLRIAQRATAALLGAPSVCAGTKSRRSRLLHGEEVAVTIAVKPHFMASAIIATS